MRAESTTQDERPTFRRGEIHRFLVERALLSDLAVRRLAEWHDVPEDTVRNDLLAIRGSLCRAPSLGVAEYVAQAIEAATTFYRLRELSDCVLHGAIMGSISQALASALVGAIREQRDLLVYARSDDSDDIIATVEIPAPTRGAASASKSSVEGDDVRSDLS